MEALIGIAVLVVLMVMGIPVAFSFAGMVVALSALYDVNVNSLMLSGFRSMNSVVLMALPLFILTGYLMQSGGRLLPRLPRLKALRLDGASEILVY